MGMENANGERVELMDMDDDFTIEVTIKYEVTLQAKNTKHAVALARAQIAEQDSQKYLRWLRKIATLKVVLGKEGD